MPEPASKNKLGLYTATSLVVGNMIGAGVFLMPAALASYGGISLFGWLFSSIGALLLAKVFSNLSRLLPQSDGGPYAYSRKGLGDFAGFLIAWGYWISIWCSNAAIAVSLVSALSVFFPILATSSVAAILTGLSAIWLLTWVNTLGVVTSGRLQLVTTILKLVPLFLIAVAGLFYIKAAHFIPFNTSGLSTFGAISATGSLTFFAFLGIECATIPAGNVFEPEKTIARATMLGTVIATIIYISGTVSVMGIIPPQQLQYSVTPFSDAAVVLWGNNAKYWVGAGVAIAAFGALNGWMLIQGQVPMAIAKDKLFPAIFGRQNKKGVPAAAIIIGSVLVSLLMAMNFTKGLVEQFKFLILLSTLTCLVPYLFSTASYVIILVEKKSLTTKAWVGTVILAALAFGYSLWAIIGSGKDCVFWGFILLLAGIPLYVFMFWKNSTSSAKNNRT